MADEIHCVRTPDGDRFRRWSTVSDAYTTDPMTRTDMLAHLIRRDVDAATRAAEDRMCRAEASGSSVFDVNRGTEEWETERCDGCGRTHHTYEASRIGSGCSWCGEPEDDGAHAPPCGASGGA